jgi:hypothetical protein
MTARDMVANSRLDRLLIFLSIAGGAALVSKRHRRVIALAGEVDAHTAVAALETPIEPADAIVRVATGVVAEVGLNHRLFICLPPEAWDTAFAHRVRRARDIIERFALHSRRSPPAAPPTSTPAHAVVFANRSRKSS